MRRDLISAAMMLALAGTACGGGMEGMNHGGGAAASNLTVDVDMVGLSFQPVALKFQRGEHVRFVFRNKDTVAHDAFIGAPAAQEDHEREMRQAEGTSGGDHGKHAQAITVEPGKRGERMFKFDTPGTVEIGCHQPGHYAAGMKMAVTVFE